MTSAIWPTAEIGVSVTAITLARASLANSADALGRHRIGRRGERDQAIVGSELERLRRLQRHVAAPHRGIAADAVEREAKEEGDAVGIERADHEDLAGGRDHVARPLQIVGLERRDGAAEILQVLPERGAERGALEMRQHRVLVDDLACRRKLPAHQLAGALLQVGKALEPEPVGEAHDGGRIDPELARHLIDGRERHPVGMVDDVFGDPLLRLGQAVVLAAQLVDDVLRAARPPLGHPARALRPLRINRQAGRPPVSAAR